MIVYFQCLCSRWKLYGSHGDRYTRVLTNYSSWEPYTSTGIAGPNMAILPNYPYSSEFPYFELSLKIWRWGQDESNHGNPKLKDPGFNYWLIDFLINNTSLLI